MIPVASGRQRLARVVARELRRIYPFRKLYLIGPEAVVNEAGGWGWPWLEPVQEDGIVEGLSYGGVASRMGNVREPVRGAGWFLQQFIKMGMARYPGVLEHYLMWDADTVPLRPLPFFSEDGRILISQEGKPVPVQATGPIHRLLGISVEGAPSLICEQMMIRSAWMRELLEEIEKGCEPGQPWHQRIMSVVNPEHVDFIPFSEFQTYGAWCSLKHADGIRLRRVRSTRAGARQYGLNPNRWDLRQLARRYDYVSFENWKVGSRWRILLNKAHAFRRGFLRGSGGGWSAGDSDSNAVDP